MNIGNCCTRDVARVMPQASLRDASLLMRNRHVGALVVVEIQGGRERPVGVVTDRDIVVAVVAPGARLESIRVGDVMQPQLRVARESDDLFDALRQMAEHGVRRLPVVAADGGLAGIVTADDLLRVLAAELGGFAAALQRGRERERAERRALG